MAAVLLLAACGGSSGPEGADETAAATDREIGAPMPVSALEEVAPVPTVIVIDASGSMAVQDAPGQRLEAAKAAVGDVMAALRPGHELGLVVYGTSTGSSDAEQQAGCQDVVVAREVGPMAQRDIAGVLAGLEPRGYTPVGLSLQTAVDLLPASGPRQVVIVSDGLDTCAPDGLGPDPCAVAGDLHGTDQDLTVSTVGFRTDADPAASAQLDCIAEAGGGQNLSAATATLLATRLSATLNQDWSAQALTSTSFRGIDLGATVDDVRSAADEELPTVRSRGVVELEVGEAVVELTDGLVSAITIATSDVRTIDGLAVGDSRADAERLYGPTNASGDGVVSVVADGTGATCFALDLDGSDRITAITLRACG
ncbi:VWA domain-containing protein [Aeromicrobium sp. Leaf350]|uniref:vWA domain-containing protein n=1 Tax=Aeromicrobium sp. Leaf350 TaxID=2876565 RepID=UPI001E4E0998|nr:VWA domain-containing protein [Aeromicrobium sp. Leaf350]